MKFEGIIPALLTPFDKGGEVNYEVLGQFVSRLVEEDIGGLFTCGGTGEWIVLTQEERMRILDRVMEAAETRTKVMAHVGATSTRFSVELAKHAEKSGAAAVSALPPVGRRYPPDAIWEHFRAIGESTGLPLYLYHVPQQYGELIAVDRFIEALDTMPTLAGVKFSSYRIDDLIELRLKAQGRLNILSGCAEQLLSTAVCGAEGSICTWYNIIPRLGNKIIDCVRNNQIEEARKHQDLLVSFGKLCVSKGLGNLKWLVSRRGFDVGRPRLPQVYPTPAEREELLPKLEAIGIVRWFI